MLSPRGFPQGGYATRRIGEPAEGARAVAFLASPAADHLTGTVLFGDGGKRLARRAPGGV